jgi:hypothetical protein
LRSAGRPSRASSRTRTRDSAILTRPGIWRAERPSRWFAKSAPRRDAARSARTSLPSGTKRFSAPKVPPLGIEKMLLINSLDTIWPSLAAAE